VNTPPAGGTVLVVGSVNLDIQISSTRRPAPGETVMGDHLSELPGGKGGNQAVAAAEAGAATSIVCAVGHDTAGQWLLADLETHHVDTSRAQFVDAPTGRAIITVTPDGENTILVIPGANGKLTASHLQSDPIQPDVVLIQLEVEMDCVRQAAAFARDAGATLILNASPLPLVPDSDLLALPDIVVVNVGEARHLLGDADDRLTEPELAAALHHAGAPTAVVTAGPRGAFWHSRAEQHGHSATPAVDAIDTTGAGDAFLGTLATQLARGHDVATAIAAATRAGAEAVTWPGARRPTRVN